MSRETMKPRPGEKLIGMPEVARRLKISEPTARRLVKDNPDKVPQRMVGQRRKIPVMRGLAALRALRSGKTRKRPRKPAAKAVQKPPARTTFKMPKPPKGKLPFKVFVLRAIKILRRRGALGVHSVIPPSSDLPSLNEAIVEYYGPEVDPVAVTQMLEEQEHIVMRPAKQGPMIYDKRRLPTSLRRKEAAQRGVALILDADEKTP